MQQKATTLRDQLHDSGSWGDWLGMGSLRTLPAEEMRKTLPERSIDWCFAAVVKGVVEAVVTAVTVDVIVDVLVDAPAVTVDSVVDGAGQSKYEAGSRCAMARYNQNDQVKRKMRENEDYDDDVVVHMAKMDLLLIVPAIACIYIFECRGPL